MIQNEEVEKLQRTSLEASRITKGFVTGDECAQRKINRLLLRSANLPDRLLARTHAEGNVVFVKEWDNVLMSTAALELQVYIGAQLSDVRTT